MSSHPANETTSAPRVSVIACCGSDSSPEVVENALGSGIDFDTFAIVSSPSEIRGKISALAVDRANSAASVVVVPVTSGRNVTLVADTAKACLEVKRDYPHLSLVLAQPPFDATKTVAWLRKAIRKHTDSHDFAVVCSTSIDEFADAELFRLARLAWTHCSGADVDVAFDGAYPALDDVVKLHQDNRDSRNYVVIRADLHVRTGQLPLVGNAALGTAIGCVVRDALHLLHDHGTDGIEESLLADHDHGYAHSHGDEDGHAHSHHHGHSHTHNHNHSHRHQGGAHAHK